jgi:hypothetical protein
MQGSLEPVYRAALNLGIANQLTNILRDVGEDLRERNRIYVPLDDLACYDITEDDLLGGMHSTTTGAMDDRWVQFMTMMVRPDLPALYVSCSRRGCSIVRHQWRLCAAAQLSIASVCLCPQRCTVQQYNFQGVFADQQDDAVLQ